MSKKPKTKKIRRIKWSKVIKTTFNIMMIYLNVVSILLVVVGIFRVERVKRSFVDCVTVKRLDRPGNGDTITLYLNNETDSVFGEVTIRIGIENLKDRTEIKYFEEKTVMINAKKEHPVYFENITEYSIYERVHVYAKTDKGEWDEILFGVWNPNLLHPLSEAKKYLRIQIKTLIDVILFDIYVTIFRNMIRMKRELWMKKDDKSDDVQAELKKNNKDNVLNG